MTTLSTGTWKRGERYFAKMNRKEGLFIGMHYLKKKEKKRKKDRWREDSEKKEKGGGVQQRQKTEKGWFMTLCLVQFQDEKEYKNPGAYFPLSTKGTSQESWGKKGGGNSFRRLTCTKRREGQVRIGGKKGGGAFSVRIKEKKGAQSSRHL